MAPESTPAPTIAATDGFAPLLGPTSEQAAASLAKFGRNAIPDMATHLWCDAAGKV